MNKLGVEIMYSLGTGDVKTYTLNDTFDTCDDIHMYVENLMGRETIFLEKDNLFISRRAVLGFNVIKRQ